MQAELRPGPGFEQLVHRADAAGQREECIRQIAHQELALGHRAHHVQLRQAGVADFAVDQHLRDHADDATAGRQRCIGERSHEADAPAAVDEREPAPGDQLAGTDCERGVLGAAAWAGPAKDTQGFH